MPIQNRKIKLTLIFLLIILSISAFSIVGIVVAFNTKQQADPPKAASCSKHTSCCDIRTSLSESEYNTYDYFHVYSLTPIFYYHFGNSEKLAIDKLNFKGKTLYLEQNITSVDNKLSNANSAMRADKSCIFEAFAGTFDGQGYSISGVSITMQNGPSVFCRTLQSGGIIKNTKFYGPTMWISSGTLLAGVIATTVESGATIQSCIVDGATFGSKIDNANTVAGAIAGSNSGTIKNCIVQGTIYYGAANAAFVDYNLKVYGIAGSNSGTIKDNVVTANTHKYDGDANGMTYDSNECSYEGNNNSYSSLADAKGKLIERSSIGGVHSTDNNNADWYEHPSYNSGNPCLRAFIPGWKNIFVRTSLNGAADYNCGFIEGCPTEIEIPSTVSSMPSIDSAESTVTIWGETYTAQNSDKLKYEFVGWKTSENNIYADFKYVPYKIIFKNPYDRIMQEEVTGCYMPFDDEYVAYDSMISCTTERTEQDVLVYKYTFTSVGSDGKSYTEKTVKYGIFAKYDHSRYFIGENYTEQTQDIFVRTQDLPIQPEVQRKRENVTFNATIGDVEISPTNSIHGTKSTLDVLIPRGCVLVWNTEGYSNEGYTALKLVFNIVNAPNDNFKVVYDLGVFYNYYQDGVDSTDWNGTYNGINVNTGFEVTPTVNQIATYLSFGNIKIDSLGYNSTQETTINSDAEDEQFLLALPISITKSEGWSANGLKYYIKYEFTSKDGTEHTVTYNITEFKNVGFEFVRQNSIGNEVYASLHPILQQKNILVTFNAIENNQATPNYIVPVVNYRDESYDNGFSILLASSIANSITCEYDKYNRTIEYCMNGNVYVSYNIEAADIEDEEGNPVDYSVLDDFTFDNTGDMGITKTTTTETTNMTEGNSYSLITITVSPQLMYKIYGGSYGGAQ